MPKQLKHKIPAIALDSTRSLLLVPRPRCQGAHYIAITRFARSLEYYLLSNLDVSIYSTIVCNLRSCTMGTSNLLHECLFDIKYIFFVVCSQFTSKRYITQLTLMKLYMKIILCVCMCVESTRLAKYLLKKKFFTCLKLWI